MGYESFYFDQIKARVNRVNAQFAEPLSTSFLRLIVYLITGLSIGEVDEYITEGGDDLGSDAIYIDMDDEEKRFKLYVIQAKYNKDLCERGAFNANVSEAVMDKFRNIFDYFASSDVGTSIKEEVKQKKQDYKLLLDDGYILDEVIFISANLGLGPAQNVIEIWNRWLAQNPFRDKIRYFHLGLKDIYLKIEELEIPDISTNVDLLGRHFEYSTPDVKGLISNISAGELVKKYEEFKDKLFQQNVRYYLGENAINLKIIASAVSSTIRDKFWFLNNGITIVCKDYQIASITTENIKVSLVKFQIVNGAQTTRAIYEAFKKTGNVDEVKVLVKIFKANEQLAELITESTNNQNPVNKRDLRSNDEIQKLLERSLLGLGYFYQRKRKQYVDKPLDRTIDNLLLAQLFHSFYSEKPHEARNQRSKLFADDAIYTHIFNKDLYAEKVIFLHKLYLLIARFSRELKRAGAYPSSILARSKFFVLFGLRLQLEKLGKNINDKAFLVDPSSQDLITLDSVKEVIQIIVDYFAGLPVELQVNEVKIFQREQIVDYLKLQFGRH